MPAIFLIALIVLARQAVQPSAVADLVVEDAWIDSSTYEPIVIRVRNPGQRIIVAWGVRAAVADSNGVVVSAGGGTDGFEVDVAHLANNPVLRPNDSYTIRLQSTRGGFTPVSVQAASVTYAIFDDNSAAGEERSIEMTFERRARDAEAWQFVERAVADAIQQHMVAEDVLRDVDAKISAASKDIRNTSAGFQVPQRIRIALRAPETARSFVDELSIEAGVRARNAANRSSRKR